jgi:hypothetical protein
MHDTSECYWRWHATINTVIVLDIFNRLQFESGGPNVKEPLLLYTWWRKQIKLPKFKTLVNVQNNSNIYCLVGMIFCLWTCVQTDYGHRHIKMTWNKSKYKVFCFNSGFVSLFIRHNRNWDSYFGIATGYGLDGGDSIPGRGKIFFSSQCPNRFWGPSSMLSSKLGALFP